MNEDETFHCYVGDSDSEIKNDVDSDDSWSDYVRRDIQSACASSDVNSTDTDIDNNITNQGNLGGCGRGCGRKRRPQISTTAVDLGWRNVFETQFRTIYDINLCQDVDTWK